MALTLMKCKNYKDLQILMLKQIPKPKSSKEKEQYQKEGMETAESAKQLWNELLQKNSKFWERDGFLNIEYLSDKKIYRRKPLARGRPKQQSVKGKRITIRLDEETVIILNSYCQTNNISESEAIRQAITCLK